MKPIHLLMTLFLGESIVFGMNEESIKFGRFGTVKIYSQSSHYSQVVLFVSGDGGWNRGVVEMAKKLTTFDALVAGISITHYLKELEKSKEKCSYPAADFELLSKFIQKKYNFVNYVAPVLVGYSSGATLIYAILVQAPPNTFCGAISLGFCPDLSLKKPFCKGNGLEWKTGPGGKGFSFLPDTTLEVPWIVLQGNVDQVCSDTAASAFVKRVKNGEIVFLQKVGHGFSVTKNWEPHFKDSFAHLIEKANPDVPVTVEALSDLPLIEVPVTMSNKNVLAIHITGDGGWGITDRGISKTLADNGISVVGLNSLQYFWKKKSPEVASKDLERILRHYLPLWKKEKLILIGYSFGADVLPFMVNRLPQDLQDRIELITLLGPSKKVDFEFHLRAWLGSYTSETDLPVLPEVEKLKGRRIICFYGEEETDSLCPILNPTIAKVFLLQGGHRIGKNYESIVETIISEAKNSLKTD